MEPTEGRSLNEIPKYTVEDKEEPKELLVNKLLLNFYATKLVTKQALEGKEVFSVPLTSALEALPPGLDTQGFILVSSHLHGLAVLANENMAVLVDAIYRYLIKRRHYTDQVEYAYDIMLTGIIGVQVRKSYTTKYKCLTHIPPCGCQCFHSTKWSATQFYHSQAPSCATDEEYIADLQRFLMCKSTDELRVAISEWLKESLVNRMGESHKVTECAIELYIQGYLNPTQMSLPKLDYKQIYDLRPRRYSAGSNVYLIKDLPPINRYNGTMVDIDFSGYPPIVHPTLELVISRYLDELLKAHKAIIRRGFLNLYVRDAPETFYGAPKSKTYSYGFSLAGLEAFSISMKGIIAVNDILALILQYLTHCL